MVRKNKNENNVEVRSRHDTSAMRLYGLKLHAIASQLQHRFGLNLLYDECYTSRFPSLLMFALADMFFKLVHSIIPPVVSRQSSAASLRVAGKRGSHSIGLGDTP